MSIAGDIDALLSNYVSVETAEQLTVDIFHFLSEADVIMRLRREGHSEMGIVAYLSCVNTLAAIVPNKNRREDAA